MRAYRPHHNIGNSSVEELKLIHQQIAELTQRANEIAQKNKAAVIDEIKSNMELFSITAEDLGFFSTAPAVSTKDSKEAPTRSPVPIKYRHGELTWTGRGKRPKWLENAIANGASLESFLVTNPA